MTPRYVDAHCHVQFDPYDADREVLIERMREEGVVGIVVGTDLASSQNALALAEKHDHLFASAGLHPNYTEEVFSPESYASLLQNTRMVAVGECGLDYFRPSEVNDEVKKKQQDLFEEHVELAVSVNKPLIIHSRPSKGTMDAYTDLISILKSKKKEYGDRLKGDVHFFVGGVEEAREIYALDFTTSFTAVITFTHEYDEVIRFAPLASILSETDAPYVAPASRRGTRNDPLAVIEVVEIIAKIRNGEREDIRAALVQNASRLFALPPRL